MLLLIKNQKKKLKNINSNTAPASKEDMKKVTINDHQICYSIFNNKGVEIQTIKSSKLSKNIFQELINQDIHFVGTGIEKIKSVIKKNKKYVVFGVPPGGLFQPNKPIDFGNSGTGIRLICGLIASNNIKQAPLSSLG